MTSTTYSDDATTVQSLLFVDQEDLTATSKHQTMVSLSTSSDLPNRSSHLQPQQPSQQHLWARHDVSGFPRTGNPRTALMHLIAGRSTAAGGLRRFCVSPDPTRIQSTSPEHVTSGKGFGGIRSRSAVSSASELEVSEAEPCQEVRLTSTSAKPQASVSGLVQHRRRRLVLKTINRSWPSSSGTGVGSTGEGIVMESSLERSRVATTTTHVTSSGGTTLMSPSLVSGPLTSRITSQMRR